MNNREIRKVAQKQLDEVEAAIQQPEIFSAFLRAEEKQAEVLAGRVILSSHPGFRAQVCLLLFRFRVMLTAFQAIRALAELHKRYSAHAQRSLSRSELALIDCVVVREASRRCKQFLEDDIPTIDIEKSVRASR